MLVMKMKDHILDLACGTQSKEGETPHFDAVSRVLNQAMDTEVTQKFLSNT